ncbi:MAG: hypothetical protein ACQEQF_12430 [Bacillota bacterium]
MANNFLTLKKKKIEQALHDKDFNHLNVLLKGKDFIIYSKDEDGKVNRARITFKQKDNFQLSMADHNGNWEATPYTGNLKEILNLITEDFGFALIDFDEFS